MNHLGIGPRKQTLVQTTGTKKQNEPHSSISTHLGFFSSAICKASLTAEHRLVGFVSAADAPGTRLVSKGWAEDVLALCEDRALVANPLNSDTDLSL